MIINILFIKKAICVSFEIKNTAKRMNGKMLTNQEHKNYYCVLLRNFSFMYLFRVRKPNLILRRPQ